MFTKLHENLPQNYSLDNMRVLFVGSFYIRYWFNIQYVIFFNVSIPFFKVYCLLGFELAALAIEMMSLIIRNVYHIRDIIMLKWSELIFMKLNSYLRGTKKASYILFFFYFELSDQRTENSPREFGPRETTSKSSLEVHSCPCHHI
jgi:hypothetical protein